MNYMQNLLHVVLITILAFFVSGPPTRSQAASRSEAASNHVEPEQFSCTNVTEISQDECEALVALYNGTDGPNWADQSGWLVTNTPCSWYGVTCDEEHITQLDLSGSIFTLNFGLQGDLPAEIGNLDHLTLLDLSDNFLSSLPTTLGNLDNLTYLDLFANRLSNLPATIGNLDNLSQLNLSFNNLSSLPPEIGNLNNLTQLSLIFNNLSSLPQGISNLDNLTKLDLSTNLLSSLPPEIGNLNNLTQLDLSSNRLITLPVTLGNLNNLAQLDLSWNRLSSLPATIGDLNNLDELQLQSNQLSNLPTDFIKLVGLAQLDLSNNRLLDLSAELKTFLDGQDPDWNARQNNINICTDVSEIPQIECDALVAISIANKSRPYRWLETTTPCSWPGITCENNHITELDLTYKQLSCLPPEIGNLNNLRLLNVGSNHLSNLPTEIGTLNNLTALYLWGNHLTSLPATLGDLTNLTLLDLSINDLSSLPTQIGNLNNLTTLDLFWNRLTSLPATIGDLNNLTVLGLNSNRLSSLPAAIGNLKGLTQLDLGANQLSNLPATIVNLNNLTELELQYNRLVVPEINLRAFVTERDADWADGQTIAPTDIQATTLSEESIELTWTPIAFEDQEGYYEISVADGDSFAIHGTTANKSDGRYVVDGLANATNMNIRIRTYTAPHNYTVKPVWYEQANELWSEYSPAVSATALVLTDIRNVPDQEEEPLQHKLFLPLISSK